MRARALFAVASLSLAWSFGPREAAAQKVNPAEAAFEKGVAAMEAKRYDEACAAIAESQRLDPRAGTLFTLAECEAARGRIATAVGLYEQYLARFAEMSPKQKANHRDREPVARAKLDALSREVPELTLVLPPRAPGGVIVKRDGAALAASALGAVTPVDPGEHHVTIDVPGGAHREMTVTLARGDKRVIVLDVPAAEAPSPPPAAPPSAAEPAPPPPPRTSGLRTGAYASLGVGAAGIAAGAILGGLAIGKQATIKSGCHDTSSSTAACTGPGLDAANAAKHLELGSDVGFGVGLAGAASALVLFLVAPKAPPATGSVSIAPLVSSRGLGVEGAW